MRPDRETSSHADIVAIDWHWSGFCGIRVIMKFRILSLYLVLLLASSAAWAETLTVVAWNLEWFPGRTPQATQEAQQQHMAAAQKDLKALNPDIFLAEEIGDWGVFSELVSVVPKLRVHTVSAFKNADGTIGRQQEAIASRLSANSTWSEPWKKGESNPPRGLGFAALTLPDGKLLFVYAVHLKSNSTAGGQDPKENTAKREDSARQLVAHVTDMEKAYKNYKVRGVIIGGDFNTNQDGSQWQGEKTIPTLEAAGFWNCWSGVKAEDRLSWRGTQRLPATTFDFFFIKGLQKAAAKMVIPSEDASDHRPVVFKLEVP